MNEEEKEAIFEIEKLTAEIYTYMGIEKVRFYHDKYKTILNLIEKQQKEIEELKSEFAINTEIHKRDLKIKELKEINECLHQTDKELFVSKDKIKEKIEELENLKEQITTNECMRELSASVEILKELLGE